MTKGLTNSRTNSLGKLCTCEFWVLVAQRIPDGMGHLRFRGPPYAEALRRKVDCHSFPPDWFVCGSDAQIDLLLAIDQLLEHTVNGR